MPLSGQDLRGAQGRVYQIFLDKVQTFVVIEQNADAIFADSAPARR